MELVEDKDEERSSEIGAKLRGFIGKDPHGFVETEFIYGEDIPISLQAYVNSVFGKFTKKYDTYDFEETDLPSLFHSNYALNTVVAAQKNFNERTSAVKGINLNDNTDYIISQLKEYLEEEIPTERIYNTYVEHLYNIKDNMTDSPTEFIKAFKREFDSTSSSPRSIENIDKSERIWEKIDKVFKNAVKVIKEQEEVEELEKLMEEVRNLNLDEMPSEGVVEGLLEYCKYVCKERYSPYFIREEISFPESIEDEIDVEKTCGGKFKKIDELGREISKVRTALVNEGIKELKKKFEKVFTELSLQINQMKALRIAFPQNTIESMRCKIKVLEDSIEESTPHLSVKKSMLTGVKNCFVKLDALTVEYENRENNEDLYIEYTGEGALSDDKEQIGDSLNERIKEIDEENTKLDENIVGKTGENKDTEVSEEDVKDIPSTSSGMKKIIGVITSSCLITCTSLYYYLKDPLKNISMMEKVKEQEYYREFARNRGFYIFVGLSVVYLLLSIYRVFVRYTS